MKYGGLKKGLMLALVLTLLPAGAAAQGSPGGVSKEEAEEARAAAAAFAERLEATRDFAAVARELYAEDFMSRELGGLSAWLKGSRSSDFMLRGIPSLTFDRALAAEADVADWKRVRLAADNLLHFMFLSLIASHSFRDLGEAERYDERALLSVFSPGAAKALDANPAASNLIKKKNSEVVVKSPGELRALAAALEEAVRLTRPSLAESLAKGRHLGANMRLFREGLARDEVKSADGDAEAAGYPAGTRLFRVYAPNAYNLLLVKQGGAMRVVWAGLAFD